MCLLIRVYLRSSAAISVPFHAFCGRSPVPLATVPAQTHAVTAIGGFQGDAVDLIALVHGDPHGAAQAAVFGHHVDFPSSAFAGQNLAGEFERPTAVLPAEPGHRSE